jgi:dTDP-glucose 4,6-dehydratase
MKVVVIGSNSFSGSNFISFLLENDYEVLALSRSSEYHEVFLPYKWSNKTSSNFTFYQMDINKNIIQIIERIKL